MKKNSPVAFRLWQVGAGFGVGCGLGVGFGAPLNLNAIPGMGTVMASLGPVGSHMGGAGYRARAMIKKLGVRNLDAGVGCGIGIGYGFGAGLMLRPGVGEQLLQWAQDKAQELIAKLPANVQVHVNQVVQQQQQQLMQARGQPTAQGGLGAVAPGTLPLPLAVNGRGATGPGVAAVPGVGAVNTPGGGAEGGSAGVGASATSASQLPVASPGGAGRVPDAGRTPAAPGGDAHATQAATKPPALATAPASSEQVGKLLEDVQVVMRTMMRVNDQLQSLKEENAALKRAVCKLDKKAPFC
eukprot:jgi/Mesvir1/7945/Mv11866-RA.1